MRSPDDLTAAALIRDAAARLFAERGAAAVTIREIAAAAGVSPALVMHHYGSKDGLKDAVDRRAVAFFEDMMADLARIGTDGGGASLAELFAARLDREPATVDYIRRLLLDGGDAADKLFAKLFEVSLAGMRSLVAAGIARPAADERIRTAWLLSNDLAVVLLRRQLTQVAGIDPLAGDGLASWSAAVMDVYTGGIFTVPATEPTAEPTAEPTTGRTPGTEDPRP